MQTLRDALSEDGLNFGFSMDAKFLDRNVDTQLKDDLELAARLAEAGSAVKSELEWAVRMIGDILSENAPVEIVSRHATESESPPPLQHSQPVPAWT